MTYIDLVRTTIYYMIMAYDPKDTGRISRMSDVKGLGPLCGARSAPLTSAIREEDFHYRGCISSPEYQKEFSPGLLHQQPRTSERILSRTAASAAAA
jgi:hypothetical protein